jgi:hypothetical protein
MKRHPDKKDILKTVLKISDESRRNSVLTHISKCSPCRRRYEFITSLLSSSDNSAITPTDRPYLRILDSLNEIEKDKKHVSAEPVSHFSTILKPAIFVAASVLVIITAIVAIRYSGIYSTEDLTITCRSIRGTLHLNNEIARPQSDITEGSILRTDKNAIAEIRYSNLMKIIVSEKTVLEVERAQQKRKKTINLAFNLSEGVVHSLFSQRGVKIDYSFVTPKAEIHSIGTEFLLNASRDRTIVILTRGSLYIKSSVSGKEVKSTEGKEYIITSSIEEKKIDAEGIRAIQSIKDYMNIKGYPKKIKPKKRSASGTEQHIRKGDREKTDNSSKDKALKEKEEQRREKQLERRRSRRDTIDNRRELRRSMKGSKDFKR